MLTAFSPSQWNYAHAAHLLSRAGFGGNPAEVDALHKRGLVDAVNSLVNYETVSHTPPPKPAWASPESELRLKYKDFKNLPQEERQKKARELAILQAQQVEELRYTWLQEMMLSPRPLQEKLTLFWHGHFATSVEKVKLPYFMWLQNETLRENASGNWKTLLTQISQDPAMLRYLDNAQNKSAHPNENYARELMELFTLGEGHYTEKDIQESARAFTGWTINPKTLAFADFKMIHDKGSKEFFGRKGDWDGSDIIRIILDQPQAAKFIAAKLWRFFAYENPSPELVESLAQTLRESQFEFKPLLKTMFMSSEFYSSKSLRTQIKSPVQWLISACKELEVGLPPAPVCLAGLRSLGQVLFGPPNVKGWDGGIAWITTNSLLTRYNTAKTLVNGGAKALGKGPRAVMVTGEMKMDELPVPPGMDAKKAERLKRFASRMEGSKGADVLLLIPPDALNDPAKLVDTLANRFFQGNPTPKDRAAFIQYVESKRAIPASEQQVRELICLMMSTPHYQLA